MTKTFKNEKVLEFYKELPFNIYDNVDEATENIKKNNPIRIYPPLKEILVEDKLINILDVGCGAGWFANSISYFFNKANVIGVDFNTVALNFANSVKNKLTLNTKFVEKDLFEIDFEKKFDLISSLGVLHHTNNCHEGLKKILSQSADYVLIGLYHKYGRKPFLDHFDSLKKNFHEKGEDFLYEEYKKLDKRSANEKHLKSWFKDQVVHPHETQHSFEEVAPIFSDLNYKILSTSLNRFENFKSYEEIIDNEKEWYDYGKKKLENNLYFPGFFIIFAKRI
jgi:SAM-dependent methyltransferase|tara:strand:- start:1593 stop:2432 length:840 start_codon:yes stop_codon:yes gene_type:complete